MIFIPSSKLLKISKMEPKGYTVKVTPKGGFLNKRAQIKD
jgi:hypothetical protein